MFLDRNVDLLGDMMDMVDSGDNNGSIDDFWKLTNSSFSLSV